MVHYSSLLLSPPSIVRPLILLPRDPGSGTHPEHPLMRSCMFSTVKCKYRYSMNSPYYTRWFDPLTLTIQHTVVYFYPQWTGFWLAKVEVERRRSDQMGKRLCRGQGCVGREYASPFTLQPIISWISTCWNIVVSTHRALIYGSNCLFSSPRLRYIGYTNAVEIWDTANVRKTPNSKLRHVLANQIKYKQPTETMPITWNSAVACVKLHSSAPYLEFNLVCVFLEVLKSQLAEMQEDPLEMGTTQLGKYSDLYIAWESCCWYTKSDSL